MTDSNDVAFGDVSENFGDKGINVGNGEIPPNLLIMTAMPLIF
jgi:hypothetical protein